MSTSATKPENIWVFTVTWSTRLQNHVFQMPPYWSTAKSYHLDATNLISQKEGEVGDGTLCHIKRTTPGCYVSRQRYILVWIECPLVNWNRLFRLSTFRSAHTKWVDYVMKSHSSIITNCYYISFPNAVQLGIYRNLIALLLFYIGGFISPFESELASILRSS